MVITFSYGSNFTGKTFDLRDTELDIDEHNREINLGVVTLKEIKKQYDSNQIIEADEVELLIENEGGNQ